MAQKDELQDLGEKVVKSKRPKKSEQMKPKTEPGDNARFLRTSLKLWDLPKVDMSDAEQVSGRIYEYFKICEDDDMKPSVAGLALALDCDRRYLWEIREGRKGKSPAVADTIKRAMKLLDAQMTDYMQNGKINPVSGIFLMKNNFGYTDKQEVIVSPNNPLGDATDPQQLAEKYRDSVVIDTDGTEVGEQ